MVLVLTFANEPDANDIANFRTTTPGHLLIPLVLTAVYAGSRRHNKLRKLDKRKAASKEKSNSAVNAAAGPRPNCAMRGLVPRIHVKHCVPAPRVARRSARLRPTRLSLEEIAGHRREATDLVDKVGFDN